jgi:hypothetical protein
MTNVDRLSVTMPSELGEAVRTAAGQANISVPAWLSAAAAQQRRHELLGAALDAWQAEDGLFTDAELEAAAAKLDVAAAALGVRAAAIRV